MLRPPRCLYLVTFLLVGLSMGTVSCGGGDDGIPVGQADPLMADEAPALLPPADPATAAMPATAVPTDVSAAPPVAAVTTPTPEPLDPLRCLSTRVRAAQMLLPLVTQPEIPGARVFAAAGELGGIGLLGFPDERLAQEIAELQLASFVPVMIASDEEGGSVQRLAELLGPIPSAASSAQSKSPDEVRRQWVEYGARVKAQGIDVIFGPVLDVGSAPGIDSRSFGDDPNTVAEYGRAVAEGLIEAGITPVFKHFPGHGRASADSHLSLPTTPSIDELRLVDLVPYQLLLSDPVLGAEAAVMIGHLNVPGLTDGTPTSLSKATVDGLLRTDLGFSGLVFTDAMNMGAIVNTYGKLEALELALIAGADVAILGSLADLTPALNYLVERADTDPGFAAIMNNRVERVLAAKGQNGLCDGAQ